MSVQESYSLESATGKEAPFYKLVEYGELAAARTWSVVSLARGRP